MLPSHPVPAAVAGACGTVGADYAAPDTMALSPDSPDSDATTKYRVGLLVMATGKYYETFFAPLLGSVQKYFFPTHDVRVFLFTDQDVDETTYEAVSVQVIRITHGPWPEATLRRYEYIDENRRVLIHLDYLFWCDVDMRFVAEVAEEILPHTVKSALVGTSHPGYSKRLCKILDFYKNIRWLSKIAPVRRYPSRCICPYETNEKSTAYVAKNRGVYYAGGFWGGRAPQILQMSATLRRNVERDLSWGHVARWHDESHLNRYFIDHPPKVLSPGFCYPDQQFLPLVRKRILALRKNHEEIRKL